MKCNIATSDYGIKITKQEIRMKTEITSGKLGQEPEYPCLMMAKCGTVFLMNNFSCGVVLFVGSTQLEWELGFHQPNLKASRMTKFEGALSLSN